jgi:hypothetical protein
MNGQPIGAVIERVRVALRREKVARLRRQASDMENRLCESNRQESLHSGIFGVWSGGIEGREEARRRSIHTEILQEDSIAALRAEADEIERSITGGMET